MTFGRAEPDQVIKPKVLWADVSRMKKRNASVAKLRFGNSSAAPLRSVNEFSHSRGRILRQDSGDVDIEIGLTNGALLLCADVLVANQEIASLVKCGHTNSILQDV